MQFSEEKENFSGVIIDLTKKLITFGLQYVCTNFLHL